MSKYRIWCIEDRDAGDLEIGLKDALGLSGTFCQHEVLKVGTKAVQRLASASTPGELPNVAVIDLDLSESGEEPGLVGVDPPGRGFIVAAELVHYARELRVPAADFPRYIIYTGSGEVLLKYQAPGALTPSGHPALLPIRMKSSTRDEDSIVTWVVELLGEITAERIRNGELSFPSEIVDDLLRAYTEVHEGWDLLEEAFDSAYQEQLAPAVRAFREALTHCESSNGRRLPLAELERVSSYGDVLKVLPRTSACPKEAVSALRGAMDAFGDCDPARGARLLERKLDTQRRALCHQMLETKLAESFPAEAHALTGGHVSTWLSPLRTIIDALSKADHHWTLLRMLKTVLLGGAPATETALAKACHVDSPQLAEKESEFRAEIQSCGLPAPTQQHLQHGTTIAGRDAADPISHFAWRFANGDGRLYWQQPWSELMTQLRGVDCVAHDNGNAAVTFGDCHVRAQQQLTDWRLFFVPACTVHAQAGAGGTEAGCSFIEQLSKACKRTDNAGNLVSDGKVSIAIQGIGPQRADHRYEKVRVTFTVKSTTPFGRPEGGLKAPLRLLQGWGQSWWFAGGGEQPLVDGRNWPPEESGETHRQEQPNRFCRPCAPGFFVVVWDINNYLPGRSNDLT
jgi:hypothetical protein